MATVGAEFGLIFKGFPLHCCSLCFAPTRAFFEPIASLAMQLTDIVVRNLTPEDKQRTYYDDNVRGFGVRVGPGGSKTFVLVCGSARERITIGRYPIISLSEARTEAKRVLAERTLGANRPRHIRFETALIEFGTQHCDRKNRASTAKETKRVLNKHFLPPFRRKYLDEITDSDIGKIIEGMSHTPSAANHAFTAARTFFRWIAKSPRRYIPQSPMSGMSLPFAPVKRKRVLTDRELVAVWRAAQARTDDYGIIVRLLILTGQRRGEIASLHSAYIDGDVITLPQELAKNGHEHTYPLGNLARTLLPHRDGLLFPARTRGTPTNHWSECKEAFDVECPIASWQLRDLRRTFATKLASLRVPPHIIERLLNHKLGTIQIGGEISAVAAVYNRHLYLEEMREAAATWEKYVSGLIAKQEQPVSARAA
jgi:integrase